MKAETAQRGVDRIVDVSLQENLQTDMACLASGGIVSAYAMRAADDQVSIPLLEAMIAGCGIRFVYIYTVPKAAKFAAISAISECLADGAYRPTIGLKLPLDAIVAAHEAQKSGQVIGKIIVEASADS